MSEFINNRENQSLQNDERQEILKQIFTALHNGKNVEDVKAYFENNIGKITVDEISKLQHDFTKEGTLPESEVKRLYAAHTAIFKGAIEEHKRIIHPEDEPGHPVHTLKLENREIESLLQTKLMVHLDLFEKESSDELIYKLLEDINLLLDIDKHYLRKEHLIFPYLEKYGIMSPSTNMWRIDDYIRDSIKLVKLKLMNFKADKQSVIEAVTDVIEQVNSMIFREENILFPMALTNLTEDEWVKIAHESDEIGFCLAVPEAEWKPERKDIEVKTVTDGYVKMETGMLSLKQLELLFNHLPIDITFIDHEDVVRYFSYGKERIFARTKAVIGRTVQNCHPPRSVHLVEKLLADFKSGTKDSEDFWIKFQNNYVYIRYFAVRDERGEYIGTLEFTQNIGPIKAIEGEKRILS